jgi:glycerol-3-phosphate dehydrogenase
MHFTANMEEALDGIDILVESVTSAGIRPVFEKVKAINTPKFPIVLTSKGIEQNSGLILPDVVVEVLGEKTRKHVGFLSGPSFAIDVIRGLPTSVVGSAYDQQVIGDRPDILTFASNRGAKCQNVSVTNYVRMSGLSPITLDDPKNVRMSGLTPILTPILNQWN